MSTGRWRQKLEKFRALGRADRWMLLHATVWLALARLMLLVLPFHRLAKRLSAGGGKTKSIPDPELLARIGRSVQAAARNVPWRSDCFPQSLAGWMLLKHHGYKGTIHLGVGRSGNHDLAGHAWLTHGESVITGGEESGLYAEIHRLGA